MMAAAAMATDPAPTAGIRPMMSVTRPKKNGFGVLGYP
jgi:hypothetical protein